MYFIFIFNLIMEIVDNILQLCMNVLTLDFFLSEMM
jgi:hypothetical protein